MAIFSAGASIIGANKQAKAADKAARAQIVTAKRAQQNANRLGRQMLDLTRGEVRRGVGDQRRIINNNFAQQNALIDGAYSDIIGDGGFQESPGYQFRLQEALDAVEASAAARGGLYSGGTMDALQERAQGVAADDYWTWANARMGRGNALAGIAGQRNSALTGLVGARTDALTGAYRNRADIGIQAGSRANATIGNALANEAIAKGNAWQMGAQGVASGINNTIKLGSGLGWFD